MKSHYLILLIILLQSCKERYSPKPSGYLRIDLEKKEMQLFKPNNCSFEFSAPNYFKLIY